MEWKPSKYSVWLFLLLLVCSNMQAQEYYDTTVIESQDTFTEFTEDYNTWYYSDSDQIIQDNKLLEPGLNQEYWKEKSRNLNYIEIEDTANRKKEVEPVKNSRSKFKFPKFKYAWIWILVAAFVLLMVLLFQYMKGRNLKNNYTFNITDEQPDEEDLKNADLMSDFDKAYDGKDYRKAFRVQYLSVLKSLVNKNIIQYKKERTNGEYVRQLRSTAVYEDFRIITLAFDEVWYGELELSKEQFDVFLPMFKNINNKILTI